MRAIVTLILFFSIPLFIFAQNIKGGVALGFNASQVDGDEVFGYHKYGLNVGPLAIIPVGKYFSFSLETLYNQKGSYQRPQRDDSLSGEYKLILNYVDVPVLFRYTDKDVFTFGTGFSWGKLVDFREWEHGRRVIWNTPYGPYKTSDVNVLIDAQFKLLTGLSFDFRYAYSVAKLRTRTFLTGEVRKQFNNIITFRLVYVFKDKPKKSEKLKVKSEK
ncbi:MAG: PorT family protein [Bacteroidetes bacterium]|nr:PorT family protein [Bacteroidota bacterium]